LSKTSSKAKKKLSNSVRVGEIRALLSSAAKKLHQASRIAKEDGASLTQQGLQAREQAISKMLTTELNQ
jgi:hypothetical protein